METITNYLNNQYTFTLSGSSLLVSGIILSIGVISILVIIINLYKKLKDSQTPKYGFLGKPLYQMAVMAVLSFGLAFSVYTTSQDTKLQDTSATNELEVILESRVVNSSNNLNLIEFSVVPTINSIKWNNNPQEEFDIIINASGPENFTEFMYKKSKNTEAKFMRNLPRGVYNFSITIITKDKSMTFYKTTTF